MGAKVILVLCDPAVRVLSNALFLDNNGNTLELRQVLDSKGRVNQDAKHVVPSMPCKVCIVCNSIILVS